MANPPDPKTQGRVFISYSRQDSAAARFVYAALKAAGFSPWIDEIELKSRTLNWENELRLVISQARAVVLIASPDSRRSGFVVGELALAEAAHRVIYPFWVQGKLWMDSIPMSLSAMQYLDARGAKKQAAVQALIAVLKVEPLREEQLSNTAHDQELGWVESLPQHLDPKPRVFVSHSHKNDDFTFQLVDDLLAAGAEVWVDKSNIQYGDFIMRISKALEASEWLVLVLTPDALASRFVEAEVNAAINLVLRGRMKNFIPFIMIPCDLDKIPAMWDIYHRYDATHDYRKALVELLRALGLEQS